MQYRFLSVILLFISVDVFAQDAEKVIYNRDFQWEIRIPPGYVGMSAEDQKARQDKGTEIVEKTFGNEVIDQTTTLFVYKKGKFNSIEANHQPFDASDGTHREKCKAVNEIVYRTFLTQMPNTQMDTATYVQSIDGLEFQTFNVQIKLPNNLILHCLMHSRPFGNKELAVNIMYINEAEGKVLMDAWMNSSFKR